MASSSSSSSSSSYNPPCAACKFLRRKCIPTCVFAPYFPPEEPEKFMNVHKIFGASNIAKLLNDVLPHQREDAVSSLAYEAEARVRDPVYGCVGVINYLQQQVDRLQKDLDAANADLIRHVTNQTPVSDQLTMPSFPYRYVNRTWNRQNGSNSLGNMSGGGGGGAGGSGGGAGGGWW